MSSPTLQNCTCLLHLVNLVVKALAFFHGSFCTAAYVRCMMLYVVLPCVWELSRCCDSRFYTRTTDKHIHFQVPRERRNTAIGVVKRIHPVLARRANFKCFLPHNEQVVRIRQIFFSWMAGQILSKISANQNVRNRVEQPFVAYDRLGLGLFSRLILLGKFVSTSIAPFFNKSFSHHDFLE